MTRKTKSVDSNKRRAVILLTVQSDPKFRFPRDTDVASNISGLRFNIQLFLLRLLANGRC